MTIPCSCFKTHLGLSSGLVLHLHSFLQHCVCSDCNRKPSLHCVLHHHHYLHHLPKPSPTLTPHQIYIYSVHMYTCTCCVCHNVLLVSTYTFYYLFLIKIVSITLSSKSANVIIGMSYNVCYWSAYTCIF